MAFYVDDLDDLGRRLEAAGVRITDAGSGNTLFCHPKDTPGMLEFHPAEGLWEDMDPRLRPEWPAFRDAFWAQHHPLGLQRISHVTVVVDDLPAAEKFYVDVLDAVPLPEQDATVPGASSRYVVVGEDSIVELLAPGDGDSVAARDLARVGPSVTGVSFTVKDLPAAAEWLQGRLADTVVEVAEVTGHDIRLDVATTWGCEYRFTDRVLTGDPRERLSQAGAAAATVPAIIGRSSSIHGRVASDVGAFDVVVGDAVDGTRVAAQDLRLDRGRERGVPELLPHAFGDIEGAECVDERLRRAVPDRVGAPHDAVGPDRAEELPEHVGGLDRPAQHQVPGAPELGVDVGAGREPADRRGW